MGARSSRIASAALLFAAVFAALFAAPALADTAIPIKTSVSYDNTLQKLHLNVSWVWARVAKKMTGVAVFADLNHDGVTPQMGTGLYNCEGGEGLGSFPIDCSELIQWGMFPMDSGCYQCLKEEALAQFYGSVVSASAGVWDSTGAKVTNDVSGENGKAYQLVDEGAKGFAHTLLPNGYKTNDDETVCIPCNGATGSAGACDFYDYGDAAGAGGWAKSDGCGNDFWLEYSNVARMPKTVCVVTYDVHTTNTWSAQAGYELKDPDKAGHGPFAFGHTNDGKKAYNSDNSVQKGWGVTTVSCTDLAAGGGIEYCTDGKTLVDNECHDNVPPPQHDPPCPTTGCPPSPSPSPTPEPEPSPSPSPSPSPTPPLDCDFATNQTCQVLSCGTATPNTYYIDDEVMTRCNCKGCFENHPGNRDIWTSIDRKVAGSDEETISMSDGTFHITDAGIKFVPSNTAQEIMTDWPCCKEDCPGDYTCYA